MKPAKRKLPPMSALEDAVSCAFRNTGLAVKLFIAWAIVLAPLAALAAYVFREVNVADPSAMPPAAMAAGAALAALGLLAFLSISVNWQRRLVAGETPKGLRWWRLDGPVWRYLFNLLAVFVVLGILAAAAVAVVLLLQPRLEPGMGPAAKPLAIAVAAIIGLITLTTWYRLSVKLPAVSSGRRDYRFGQAWRDTRGNTLRFLGLTFWYVFALAIAGGIGAGAFFGQKIAGQPWALPAAAVVIAIAAWYCVWISMSIAPSLYRYWGENRDFPAAK